MKIVFDLEGQVEEEKVINNLHRHHHWRMRGQRVAQPTRETALPQFWH